MDYTPKPLLTIEQAAEFIGMKKTTVQDYVRRSQIPYIGLNGRALRFRTESLVAWVAELETPVKKLNSNG